MQGWIIPVAAVEASALQPVAARARDRDVLELISAAVCPRHDVFEGGRCQGRPVGGDLVAAPAVDAFAVQHAALLGSTPTLLKCVVGGGRPEQEAPCFRGCHFGRYTERDSRGEHRQDGAVDEVEIEVLTFDCYGTLVDWETGILGAVLPLLHRYGVTSDADRVLAAFARAESAVQSQREHVAYKEVLRRTFCEMAKDLGFTPAPKDANILLESFGRWPLFPDTVASLQTLAARWPLGIISNVDDDLLAETLTRVDVSFTWRITAERVGAYKPRVEMFEAAAVALARSSDARRRSWVHVGQSRHHDIAPARAFGLRTAHVVRPTGRQAMAVPACDVEGDWRVDDLRGLCEVLERVA